MPDNVRLLISRTTTRRPFHSLRSENRLDEHAIFQPAASTAQKKAISSSGSYSCWPFSHLAFCGRASSRKRDSARPRTLKPCIAASNTPAPSSSTTASSTPIRPMQTRWSRPTRSISCARSTSIPPRARTTGSRSALARPKPRHWASSASRLPEQVPQAVLFWRAPVPAAAAASAARRSDHLPRRLSLRRQLHLRIQQHTGQHYNSGTSTPTGAQRDVGNRQAMEQQAQRAQPDNGANGLDDEQSRPHSAPTDQTFGGVGIIGFSPASTKGSILIFKKKQRYNEWEFVYDLLTDMRTQAGNTGNIGQPASSTSTPVGSSGFGSGFGLAQARVSVAALAQRRQARQPLEPRRSPPQ